MNRLFMVCIFTVFAMFFSACMDNAPEADNGGVATVEGYNDTIYNEELFDFSFIENTGTQGISNAIMIDYLLAKELNARNLVQVFGLAALCDGETTVVPGAGTCRTVWLGANNPDGFDKQTLYAIADNGDIYFYEIVYEEFELVYRYGPGMG